VSEASRVHQQIGLPFCVDFGRCPPRVERFRQHLCVRVSRHQIINTIPLGKDYPSRSPTVESPSSPPLRQRSHRSLSFVQAFIRNVFLTGNSVFPSSAAAFFKMSIKAPYGHHGRERSLLFSPWTKTVVFFRFLLGTFFCS